MRGNSGFSYYSGNSEAKRKKDAWLAKRDCKFTVTCSSAHSEACADCRLYESLKSPAMNPCGTDCNKKSNPCTGACGHDCDTCDRGL